MLDSKSPFTFFALSLQLKQSGKWALHYRKCFTETQPTHAILMKIL